MRNAVRTPERPPASRARRVFTAASLVLLTALTGALVYATTRSEPPPPAAHALAPGLGAVALDGTTVWRWSAGSTCERTTGQARATAERRDGTVWQPVELPLSTIKRLSFGGGVAIALGTDERCRNAVATTADGGATWRRVEGSPQAFDWATGGAWRIAQDEAGVRTVERATSPDGPWTAVGTPCSHPDGDLYDVTAVDARTAWLVCQGPAQGVRLLVRTTDGGTTWERRTDTRPQTGLDGDATLRRLSLTTGPRGWLLMSGSARCAEGELRTTVDTGLSWTPLPCPSQSVPVRVVFDVAFAPDGNGVLVGLVDGAPALLSTADGGRTWRQA